MGETPEQLPGQLPKEEEKERLDLGKQAMTEIRDKLFEQLTPEQRKIAASAKLSLEKIASAGTSRPGVRIKGEVTLKGEVHDVELFKIDGTDAVFARVDTDRFFEDEAKALFEFYYPIAQIINESEHYPTDASYDLYKKKLVEGLLGK